MLEKLAACKRSFAHQGEFIVVFHHAEGFDHGAGERREEHATKARWQRRFPAREFSHRCPRWIETRELYARLSSQPLGRGDRRRSRNDLNLGGLDLLSGLHFVAAVSKQARRSASDGQSCTRTGEAGKITDVGKMSDEKARKPGACQPATQLPHAAYMVHPERYITARQKAC